MSKQKPRILWLEDDQIWVNLLRDLIEETYTVVSAQSIEEAGKLLESSVFDLIIVDVSLVLNSVSDRGGFEFIEKYLKSKEILRNLPIIVVSGTGTFERLREAWKDYRISAWLPKSELSSQEFQETITKVMQETYPTGLPGEPARILVIDDEPGWRQQLKEILEEEGYVVDVAETVQQAIDGLRSQRYRLMTVDIRMKEPDPANEQGLDFLDRMRRMGLQIDTIVVTAHSNEERLTKAFEEFGVHRFITKDQFDDRSFRYLVRQILSLQVYVIVHISDSKKSGSLKQGKESRLSISAQIKEPDEGILYTLISRPATSKDYEVEAVISQTQPRMEILPNYRQRLTILPDGSSKPLGFKLTPEKSGKGEVVLEFQYGSGGFRRLKIPVSISSAK